MRVEKTVDVGRLLTFALMSSGTLHGCFVHPVCFNTADCKDGQVCILAKESHGGVCRDMCETNADCKEGYLCDQATHVCEEADCRSDNDCAVGFDCVDGLCVSETALICPGGMVPVERRFCVDKYEASRPDATHDSEGIDDIMATSRPGVIPWRVTDNEEAAQACLAAGKSLCTEEQWFTACRGTSNTVYSYGDEYDPSICNGIDTYCYCDADHACSDRTPCPYPYCFEECGASLQIEPTGHFPECTNDYGVYDMNGNVWEHVLNGDDTRIRGGAFNCLNSKRLHRCDYIPGDWTPDARGFRCCSEGLRGADTETAVDSENGTEQ